jgi:hypothetical protein
VRSDGSVFLAGRLLVAFRRIRPEVRSMPCVGWFRLHLHTWLHYTLSKYLVISMQE